MTACPSCRVHLPHGARFCPACGASLSVATGVATERKVVTTLFADLVDFTALGERSDPEDVDAGLRAYFELARSVIERFGGAVEKFIGDAVVGLFGVPAAHEDDAERAVRAALEIVARMRELPAVGGERLETRAGVNTGPALVRLDVLPHSGEGMLVGDAVNTAARLLTASPRMAVVAGASTHRLTERAIAYEHLPALSAKGKTLPVERWVARGAISRRGIDADQDQTPMVGREVEFAILSGLLDKAIASTSPQFALITGEAGIGKSRVVREFFRLVDEREGLLVTWRQGRCPPYGDGLSFWALREIAKAHAGVLPGDDPPTVEQKLVNMVSGGEHQEWILSRLRPLVGLHAERTDREDSFAAWTQFLQDVATTRPTVLVIEDLHWASDPTLAFLSHFAHAVRDVPLLLVGTARPEFLDAQVDVDQAPGLTRIDLKALTEEESARLASGLSGTSTEPDILRRVAHGCGGNPLFAEELVRYFLERSGGGGDTVAAEVRETGAPTTLLALIASRLDALPPDRKATLTDAAVVGRVFWTGALSKLGDREPKALALMLDELTERELIRKMPDSSVKGQQEYSFWHALTRDVAYQQLPRATRASKHADVAGWLETTVEEGLSDLAEILAFHYCTALDLAKAATEKTLAEDLVAPTIRSLRTAGDAALALDVSVAQDHYARAVALTQADHPDRAELLLAWGETLVHIGRFKDAMDVFQEAALEMSAAGHGPAAAAALRRADTVQSNITGRSDEALLQEADLLDTREPSTQLATALEYRAGWASWKSLELAISLADQAIEMCTDLGLPEPLDAIESRGWCRAALGDIQGLDDLRTALRLADSPGHLHKRCGFSYNLAEMLLVYRGAPEALAVRRKGLEEALARRDTWATGFCREGEFLDLVWSGQWDVALEQEADVGEFLKTHGMTLDLQRLRSTGALLRTWRGDTAAAKPLAEWAEESSRATEEPGSRVSSLVALAVVSEAVGDHATARRLLEETAALPAIAQVHPDLVLRLPAAIRSAFRLGESHLAERLAKGLPQARAFDAGILDTLRALTAEHAGQARQAGQAWGAAGARWRELGVPYEAGLALLGEGRCLAAMDDSSASRVRLSEACAVFLALGAAPALAETESLLRA